MRKWLDRHKATILADLSADEEIVDLNGLRPYEGILRRLHKSDVGYRVMVSKFRAEHNVKCSHQIMRSWIKAEESAPGEALFVAVTAVCCGYDWYAIHF